MQRKELIGLYTYASDAHPEYAGELKFALARARIAISDGVDEVKAKTDPDKSWSEETREYIRGRVAILHDHATKDADGKILTSDDGTKVTLADVAAFNSAITEYNLDNKSAFETYVAQERALDEWLNGDYPYIQVTVSHASVPDNGSADDYLALAMLVRVI